MDQISIILLVVVIFVFLCLNNNTKFRENLFVGKNPTEAPICKHVKKFKKPYVESYYLSNYSDAYDCYKQCLNSAECQYVGVGFDCYDNCFNNVKFPGNTVGDYNQ